MNPMNQPLLQVRGLKKAYGAIQAVGGVSFEVRPGEIFGVIGPNGNAARTRVRVPSLTADHRYPPCADLLPCTLLPCTLYHVPVPVLCTM